ncbi:MAG TPA: hypothetical protein VNU71_20565 [Burkholderiaceae bacterium]|nr:hypothetical protein [Burkholderiaceae bacterium]
MPERWSAEAGARDVAKLDIPADALRERRFEITVRLVVANPAGRDDASHGLRVLIDGALEWSRRVPTDPGASDSLDWRVERAVPAGRPLRLSAAGELRGVRRVRLSIEAEEA